MDASRIPMIEARTAPVEERRALPPGTRRTRIGRRFSGEPPRTPAVDPVSDASPAVRARSLVKRYKAVYTKHIGEEPKMIEPVVLAKGGTVADAALSIHREFAAKLKFARVWGAGKFDGQRVQHDFVLTDGDIIEFHI